MIRLHTALGALLALALASPASAQLVSGQQPSLGYLSTTQNAQQTGVYGNSASPDVDGPRVDLQRWDLTSAGSTGIVFGRTSQMTTIGGNNITGAGHTGGLLGRSIHAGSGTIAKALGLEGSLQNTSNGTITTAIGVQSNINQTGTGTITNLYGYDFFLNTPNNGTISNVFGYFFPDLSAFTIGGGKFAFYNADPNATIYSQGPFVVQGSFATGTSNIAVGFTPYDKSVYFVDATSGGIAVTLAAAAALPGYRYTIKKVDSSINAVTLSVSGGGNIDGASTKVLATQYSFVTVQSNGTQWFIVG